MKIDSAIKEFVEKYDREAMDSITNISQEYGLVIHERGLNLFGLKESFDTFKNFLEHYATYTISNKDNIEASPQSAIFESGLKYIDTQIFTEKEIKYKDLPEYVASYPNGINSLLETVNNVNTMLKEGDAPQERIGYVQTLVEHFMEVLEEKFDGTMNRILKASGYTTSKNLKKNYQKTNNSVFI